MRVLPTAPHELTRGVVPPLVDGDARSDYPTPGPRPVFPGAFFSEPSAVSSPILTNDTLLAQNVQPKAGTPGVAVDSSAPPSGGGGGQQPGGALGGLLMPLMMLLVFAPIIFMMSRRQKKEAQARAALKKGDRVMSNAGLIGELIELDDRVAKVKIAPGVTVNMVANTVSPFTEAEKAPAKELKDAKPVTDKK
jgi:preprotein translocase subunit YajC